MSGAHLFGWDNVNKWWVKLLCNAEGKLIIDPSEIFENPPTEDEAGKAPQSAWAFDHEANESAHHTKYTDAEARAAIGGLFTAAGILTKQLSCNFNPLQYVLNFTLRASTGHNNYVAVVPDNLSKDLSFYSYKLGVGYQNFDVRKYNGSVFLVFATEDVVDTKIATHSAIAAAHHTRYTDAEAIAAVGYNGTKYWSCPGTQFDPEDPETDDISKWGSGILNVNSGAPALVASIFLPHGAVVTSCIVRGNDGSSDVVWRLVRNLLASAAIEVMATANVNTSDTSILYETIDNSLYDYCIYTDALEANDRIYGVTITYTI